MQMYRNIQRSTDRAEHSSPAALIPRHCASVACFLSLEKEKAKYIFQRGAGGMKMFCCFCLETGGVMKN